MAHNAQHLRHALRRLARAPRFAVIAVVTLAIAVGANAAVFGVLRGVLLKPLPYPQSDRLVAVWHTAPAMNIADLSMGPSNYFIYREQSRTFQDIGIYQGGEFTVTGTGEPEHVEGLNVTDGVLPLLGVTPIAGRLFTRADDSSGAPHTVILGHAYWLRAFAANPAVLGHTLSIDGTSREIIGILPREFHFLDRPDPALVLPMQLDRAHTSLGQFSYQGLARLTPGVTMTEANADVARMLPIVLRTFASPGDSGARILGDAHIAPNLRPLKQQVIGDIGNLLGVLMGGLAIVFVIACANVANLWLVRLEGRRRELALRAALGASGARIARELLGECLMIGAAAGVAGIALAAGALRALVAVAPADLPRVHDIVFDLPMALFTMTISLAASVLFGGVPAFKYAALGPNTGMRDAGRSVTSSRQQRRARSVLVVAQVALALILLIGSGLMIRTFVALTHVRPGFDDPASLQTFRVYFPESSIPEPDRLERTQETIRERLAAIPGVSATAVANGVPLDGHYSVDPVFAQDRVYREGEIPKPRRFKYVMPGYFATIGTTVVAGRDFTQQDIEHRTPVAVISRDFAAEYWSRPEQALGKRIRVSPKDDWREIVGVAADVYDNGVSRDPVSIVYWPIIQERFEGSLIWIRRSVTFVMRTPRAGTSALLRDMQQAVWAVDPDVPLFGVQTIGDLARRSTARTSFMLMVLGLAGSMALLLGVVGLYGVVAYSVSQRTREIGIRMALGARPELVTNMFLRDGLRLALAGVACGMCGAWFAVRLMSALLFHVSPADALTYALASLGLVAISLVAAYLPSRRAAAIDPTIALRAE